MITHDPYKVLTSWNHSFHFCDWSGISCGKRHKRATALRLDSQGLEGSLSPHVGNLSFLRELYLSNNSFQATIPHELGRLSGLRSLYLDENNFTGFIPANLSHCSNLEELWLGQNKLAGSIPKEMSLLSKLAHLVIEDNKLTGGIPPFMGNITSMESFSAAGNPLSGRIPDTLGLWKSLREFDSGEHPYLELHRLCYMLWGNKLTGVLPPSLSNCSKLVTLEMSDNNFSGKLTIDFSKLRGPIPDAIGNLSLLTKLYLYSNKLEGHIPSSIGNCTKLTVFSLADNRLSGKIPKQIIQLPSLSIGLDLSQNSLSGSIPSDIKDLKIGNSISSKYRSSISSLRGLEGNERFLKVSYNELLKATDGFSAENLIGEGGFSSVYKGILDANDDRFVAIKVLHLLNREREITAPNVSLWENEIVCKILGLTRNDGEEIKKCYMTYLDVFTSYYKTARAPEVPTNVEEDSESLVSYQWNIGKTYAPIDVQKGKEKLEHFGIKLEEETFCKEQQSAYYGKDQDKYTTYKGPSTSRISDKEDSFNGTSDDYIII
ncbi:kinase-like domain-containing protein [Tanacetum coccineum]